MNFREWINLQEKMLYHGTTLDRETSIRKLGIIGDIGDFVKDAYDDPEYGKFSDEDHVAYAADKKSLSGAVTAMAFHIGKKLGKDLHDVTDTDIRNHGLIVKIDDYDDSVKQRPGRNEPNDYEEYPRAVEPGDYYFDRLKGDQYLKGPALLRFLTRMHEWPRDWGKSNPKSRNLNKGHLVNLALKHHPDIPKSSVLSKIHSLSHSDIQKHLSVYQDLEAKKKAIQMKAGFST